MKQQSEVLYNLRTGETLVRRLVRCEDFFSRGRGLMFRAALAPDEAYLFVLDRASVSAAAIHMFFVSFPISVLWLDEEMRVVDMVRARPWRPYYAPKEPARFFLEGHPVLLQKVQVGDILRLAGGQ